MSNKMVVPALISIQRVVIFSSVLSFYALKFYSSFNSTYVIAGVIIFAAVSMGSVFQVIAGSYSDRFGRKRTALIGQVGQGSGLLVMGYSFLQSNILLSVAGFLIISMGGNSLQASINALVADNSETVGERVRSFAIVRTAINSGFGFGPLMTGFLLANLDYGFLLIIMGIASFVFIVFFVFLKEAGVSRQPVIKQPRQKFRFDNLVKLSIAVFLLAMVFGQLTSAIPVYEETVNRLSYGGVGALVGLNGLVIVLVQYPISRLVKDPFNWRWMGIGAAVYSLAVILFSVLSGLVPAMLVMVLITLGEAVFWAPAQTLITSISNPGKYGRNLGIWSFSVNIGRGAGAEYGLLFLTLFFNSHVLAWFMISIPGLVSAVIFSRLISNIRRKSQAEGGKQAETA